jgi:hypothetical protein
MKRAEETYGYGLLPCRVCGEYIFTDNLNERQECETCKFGDAVEYYFYDDAN